MSALTLKFRDLRSAARAHKLTDVVGRDPILTRLVRVLVRPDHHHALLVGAPGSGLSATVNALAVRMEAGLVTDLEQPVYKLDIEPLLNLIVSGANLTSCLTALADAASQLKESIVVIEDIHLLATDDPNRIELTIRMLQPFLGERRLRVLATASAEGYRQSFAANPMIHRFFTILELPDVTASDAIEMVRFHQNRLAANYDLTITDAALNEAVRHGRRFALQRALPDAALRLLDEAAAQADLAGATVVAASHVRSVLAEHVRVPLTEPDAAERSELGGLEGRLATAVVGQPRAIEAIASTIVRARLGLVAPGRPRGSFLLLGPSGVGKTETGKAIAEQVFGSARAFIRLDMSEYGEAHAAVRLIGAPPGYVGYSEGGQLTNPVAAEPYSLVLLDEIEKAHPKVFDLFLQVLDDGRLTDSTGQTVDFSQTIVMATSNSAAADIITAHQRGDDIHGQTFMDEVLYPALLTKFRPEFLNRFDRILVYEPLGLDQLVVIARKELARLMERAQGRVRLDPSDQELREMLRPVANPLLGARPVRRVIQEQFEAPLAAQLLRGDI